MFVGSPPIGATPTLPTAQSDYSPSARALGIRLVESIAFLMALREGSDPTIRAPLDAYLTVVGTQGSISPKVFHDLLWEAVGEVRTALATHSEAATVFDAAHNLLVRNSASGHVLGDRSWVAGAIDDLAKIYFTCGLKRASIGLTRDPFLWEAPSILLALSKGREKDPHVHEKTVETGLSFAEGTKLYRHIGTPIERVDTQGYGS